MSLKPTQPAPAHLHMVLCMGIAAALHLPMLWWVGSWEVPPSSPAPFAGVPTDGEFQVNLLSPPEPKEKPVPDPATEEDEMQFVSAPLPEVEEVPDKARFLDRVSSKAERETVRKAAPGAPAETQHAPKASSTKQAPPEQASTPEKARDTTETRRGTDENLPEGGEQARMAMPDLPLRQAPAREGGGGEAARIPLPNFANSPVVNPMGDNGSIDYLRDVDEGEKTLLNRKESRYWAFFDRVKVQIAEEWAPVSTYRKRDPYGNVYGVKDRYSQVRVTLNSDGTVRQLFMARPSGLDFFDDEAVRSIRAAAPFHNPPEGLKDEDGLVHFTFGFYFEVTAGPTMRVFR